MYIYKEPNSDGVLRTLDMYPVTLSADAVANWENNTIKFSYTGVDYHSPYKDSVVSLIDASATIIYTIWWPFENPFYGGLFDLTSGIAYSLYDADGNTLEQPETKPILWIANSYSPNIEDYTEGPIPRIGDAGYNRIGVFMYVSNSTYMMVAYATLQFSYRTHTEVDMNIITGYVGEPHITAAQDRAANQGSYGEDSYILNVGSKLAATASSATEIHIADGAVSHQGCVGVIDQGTYDVVEISPGSQGYKRIDLIVCRYERNADTNEESLSVVAIEGTPAASNPSVPAYTQGDIQGGDLIADMPLFQVLLNGITIQSITNVANAVLTQAELTAAVNALEDDILMEASGNLLSASQTIATMKQVAVEVTIPTKTGYSIIAASPRTLSGGNNTKVMMELDVQTGYLKLFNTHTASVTISAASFNIIYKKN